MARTLLLECSRIAPRRVRSPASTMTTPSRALTTQLATLHEPSRQRLLPGKGTAQVIFRYYPTLPYKYQHG